MTKVLIRANRRDDFIAKHCYDSFRSTGFNANYFLMLEEDTYKHCIDNPDYNIRYRSKVDNFGGQQGVKGFIEMISQLDYEPDEIVIISDADIEVHKSFDSLLSSAPFDFMGVGNPDLFFGHVSGQMMIVRGKILSRLKREHPNDIELIIGQMLAQGCHIADDTFLSYYVWIHPEWQKRFIEDKSYWTHEKLYHLEGKRELE